MTHDLHRMVDHVAGDHRRLPGGLDAHADMARGMTRCRDQAHLGRDPVVTVDEAVQAGGDDGLDALGEACVVLLVAEPVLVFGGVEQVLRVRERGHPRTVVEHRVPPDVVHVQVGADHRVDGVATEADGPERVEMGRAQIAEVGQFVVVTETRVDDQPMCAGPDRK